MGFEVWSGLLGGLALFMLGLDVMTRALKIVAGDRMRDLMARLTSTRAAAVATGAAVTAAVNSSSVTTVLLVGFVSAGFMTMAQGIGVVMGANIGSTMTAQIIAFDVGKLALPAVAAGFLASMVGRRERTRNLGLLVLGLGLVFYGMGVMSDAMRPLRGDPDFAELLRTLESVPLAVLAGVAFTALVQSSAATTGIVMAMAAQGLMGLEAAIAVALGANIGTCLTAGLAVIGKPAEAVRLFLVHLLFNVVGALIWMPFIGELADMARAVSAAFGAGGDVARHIANAHTLFNVANTLLFIGFTTQIAWVITRLTPTRRVAEALEPRHLDPALITVPAVAVESAGLETARFGRRVAGMLETASARLALRHAGRDDPGEPLLATEPVEALYRLRKRILVYLSQIGSNELSAETAVIATDLVQAVELLNSMMEVTATLGSPPLTEPGGPARPPARPLPPHLVEAFAALGRRVHDHVLAAVDALERHDAATARTVTAAKQDLHGEVRRLTDALFHALIRPGATDRTGFTSAMADVERLSRIDRLARKLSKLTVRGVRTPEAAEGAAFATSPGGVPTVTAE